jgi:hypothetical protein
MEIKMTTRVFRQLALAAAVSLAAMSQASAGGCCNCGVPCVAPGLYIPVLQVPNVAVVSPYYVVHQGPVFTGPGLVSYPGYYEESRFVGVYPYRASVLYYSRFEGGVGLRPAKRVRLYR